MIRSTDKHQDKKCIDCAQSVPSTASKCGRCGSYQDWRRHVTVAQGALSLPVSLLALATAIVLTGQQASHHIQSAVFPDVSLQFGIADIDAEEVSLVVTNPTSRPAIINSLSCSIWVPLGREWIERSEGGLRQITWPYKEESIGVFLITYRPSEAVMLTSGAQKAIIAGVSNVAPPSLQGETSGPAPAGCFLGATNDRNELVAGAVMLNPIDLIAFNALEMVEAASYSEAQRDQMEADKARIASYVN